MTEPQFCRRCRWPVAFDGFDWYHADTGYYLSYIEDPNKKPPPAGGEVHHAAVPGGKPRGKK